MKCSCWYSENKREPKYLNEVLGDTNTERVIADIYQEHIGSGSIWNMTDDILEEYFNNSIDHEVAKRMARHTSRIFVDVD